MTNLIAPSFLLASTLLLGANIAQDAKPAQAPTASAAGVTAYTIDDVH